MLDTCSEGLSRNAIRRQYQPEERCPEGHLALGRSSEWTWSRHACSECTWFERGLVPGPVCLAPSRSWSEGKRSRSSIEVTRKIDPGKGVGHVRRTTNHSMSMSRVRCVQQSRGRSFRQAELLGAYETWTRRKQDRHRQQGRCEEHGAVHRQRFRVAERTHLWEYR